MVAAPSPGLLARVGVDRERAVAAALLVVSLALAWTAVSLAGLPSDPTSSADEPTEWTPVATASPTRLPTRTPHREFAREPKTGRCTAADRRGPA